MSDDPRPYSNLLATRREELATAYRGPISPSSPIPADGSIPELQSVQAERRAMLHIPYVFQTAGDNILIPSLIGRKIVYEFFLYNPGGVGTSATLQLYQGPSTTGTLLLQLTDFSPKSQLLLPFSGNLIQSHFDIESGQSMVMNLSASTEISGFLRYRIDNNSAG